MLRQPKEAVAAEFDSALEEGHHLMYGNAENKWRCKDPNGQSRLFGIMNKPYYSQMQKGKFLAAHSMYNFELRKYLASYNDITLWGYTNQYAKDLAKMFDEFYAKIQEIIREGNGQ